MEAAKNLGELELYDAGHFGDARLKERCDFAPAHGGTTNGVFAPTGRLSGTGSSVRALVGE